MNGPFFCSNHGVVGICSRPQLGIPVLEFRYEDAVAGFEETFRWVSISSGLRGIQRLWNSTKARPSEPFQRPAVASGAASLWDFGSALAALREGV